VYFLKESEDWKKLGGSLTSSPVAISPEQGRIDVFAKSEYNTLIHISRDGARWSKWENCGGVLTSRPAVVSPEQGRIDFFARGDDNGLIHLWWENGKWSDWEKLGGVLITETEAAP